MSEFIIGFLLFLILASNIYWARVCYQLVNRVMAKDYAEFKAYEQRAKLPPNINIQPDLAIDQYAEKQALELNSLIGVS